MKIKFLFFILAISVISISSCKKNYSCACNKVYPSSGITVADGKYNYNETKATAVIDCNAQETSGSDVGGAYNRECAIE